MAGGGTSAQDASASASLGSWKVGVTSQTKFWWRLFGTVSTMITGRPFLAGLKSLGVTELVLGTRGFFEIIEILLSGRQHYARLWMPKAFALTAKQDCRDLSLATWTVPRSDSPYDLGTALARGIVPVIVWLFRGSLGRSGARRALGPLFLSATLIGPAKGTVIHNEESAHNFANFS